MPALVQHFEGVRAPRLQGSAAAVAAPADGTLRSSTTASATSLAVHARRVMAAVSGPVAAETSAEVHRQWTQSREDAPSISRAAVRDSVYGPAASTAAPYWRRTEEAAGRSEQATPETVVGDSSVRSSVISPSEAMATADVGASPALQPLPTVPLQMGSVQLNPSSGTGVPVPAWSGDSQTEVSRSDRPGTPAASAAGDSSEQGVTRTRSQRMVRFSSGLADDADGGNDMRAPNAGLEHVSDRALQNHDAAEFSEQPLQPTQGDRSAPQVRRQGIVMRP